MRHKCHVVHVSSAQQDVVDSLYLSRQCAHNSEGSHIKGNSCPSCQLGLVHFVAAPHHIPWATASFDNDCSQVEACGLDMSSPGYVAYSITMTYLTGVSRSLTSLFI